MMNQISTATHNYYCLDCLRGKKAARFNRQKRQRLNLLQINIDHDSTCEINTHLDND